MVLDKVLASVRIGAAEVDTVVENDELVPCEAVSGTVVVEGGDVDQDIEGLEHSLVASTPDEDEAVQVTLETHQVADPFTVEAGDRTEIPFEWQLHPQTPVTEYDVENRRVDVWIDTGLAIDKAIDAGDKDELAVSPTEAIDATVDAMEGLGLELYQLTADGDWLEMDLDREDDPQVGAHIDQEFDFRETDRYDGPSFKGYQLHFLPNPREGETDVLVELERHGGGEAFDQLTVDHGQLDTDSVAGDLLDSFEDLA